MPTLDQVRPDSIYNRDYNAPTEAEKTLGDVSALPAPMQVPCSCSLLLLLLLAPPPPLIFCATRM